jgi:hypothetical protein
MRIIYRSDQDHTVDNGNATALQDYFRDVIATASDEFSVDAQVMLQLIAYLQQQDGDEVSARTGHLKVTFAPVSQKDYALWIEVAVFKRRFHLIRPWIGSTAPPWPDAEIHCFFDDVAHTGQAIINFLCQPAPPKRLRIADLLEVGSPEQPTIAGILLLDTPATLQRWREPWESLMKYYASAAQQPHPLFQGQAQHMMRLLPLLEQHVLGYQYDAATEHMDLLLRHQLRSERVVRITPGHNSFTIAYTVFDDEPWCRQAHVAGRAADLDVAMRMTLVALQRTFGQEQRRSKDG